MTSIPKQGSGSSQALTEKLFESSPDAIVITDKDGRITKANAQVETLFGYTRGELLGLQIETLIPDRLRTAHVAHRESYAVQPSVRWLGTGLEFRGKCKDGTEFPIDVMLSPLQIEDETLFVAMIRDVTERERIETALQRSEERFRLIVDGVRDFAIFMLDPSGRVSSWNPGAEHIKQYKAEEITGEHFSRFYSQEDIERGKPDQDLKMATLQGQLEEEGYRVRKDGSRFWASVVITAIRNKNGELLEFSKVIRDVTDRKVAEEALQEKNSELASANQAKDRFLATMSHELRTPLNAIIGFTGTLLMKLPGPLTGDQNKQLQTIQTSARHLLSLINDLLDLAKIESGKVQVTLEPVDCGTVLEEVATGLRPLAEAKGLRFETFIPNEHNIVQADRRALSQILINLTNNAIKFTENGSVRLEIRHRDEEGAMVTEISVTDTGTGIRPEDQGILFQAFARVNIKGTKRSEGTGLGLHLSQRLAEILGGHIVLESEFGKGSRFTLVLVQK
jgi:PAS domain S-box-containing protein